MMVHIRYIHKACINKLLQVLEKFMNSMYFIHIYGGTYTLYTYIWWYIYVIYIYMVVHIRYIHVYGGTCTLYTYIWWYI